MNKIILILLSMSCLSFGSSKFSFLFKYDYGFPLKQSYLGESLTKRNVSDTLLFDKNEDIYSSFGKGNNLTLGLKYNYIHNFPFVFLFTYHLPTKIIIERNLQGYDDSDIWEYSFFSINCGLEIRKALNINNILFLGLYPGLYIPNKGNRHGYNTVTDSYFNVISDQQEEYDYPFVFNNNIGFLSSFGIERIINKTVSLVISISPDIVFTDGDYSLSYKKYSFSSIRISIGLKYH